MHLHRSTIGLVAAILFLALAGSATAQNLQPFGPIDWEPDGQPFAPPDVSTYGNGPSLNYGVFFEYDRLYWTIGAPHVAQIGFPGPQFIGGTPIPNSLNTSDFGASFTWGNRFELGYIEDCGYGWELSYQRVATQENEFAYASPNLVVLFNDPLGIASAGVLVGLFGSPIHVLNETRLNSLELLHLYRSCPDDFGSYCEFGIGPRYVQLDDTFTFDDFGVTGTKVKTNLKNNLVGGELAFKWKNVREKWTFGIEARGMVAANFQNTQQIGRLVLTADDFDNSFTNGRNDTELAEVAELRVETSYQLTKAIAVRVEYTAMGMDGISRASERVDYALPNMGINNSNRREGLFVNGISFGIEVNR